MNEPASSCCAARSTANRGLPSSMRRPRPGEYLPAVDLAAVDDRCDLVVAVAEHFAHEEHRALDLRERLEQHEERQRQGIGHLGHLRRAGVRGSEQRLRQPRPDVGLAFHARGPQFVDRKAGDDGCQERLRRRDLLAGAARALEAQKSLLNEVLGVADAAEHPVGDREQQRSEVGLVRHLRAQTNRYPDL